MDDFKNTGSQPWAGARSGIGKVQLRSGVTAIGAYAFSGCKNLTSITIPAEVKSIGAYALYNCGSLADIYFEGSEEQWAAVTCGPRAVPDGAVIHFGA